MGTEEVCATPELELPTFWKRPISIYVHVETGIDRPITRVNDDGSQGKPSPREERSRGWKIGADQAAEHREGRVGSADPVVGQGVSRTPKRKSPMDPTTVSTAAPRATP